MYRLMIILSKTLLVILLISSEAVAEDWYIAGKVSIMTERVIKPGAEGMLILTGSTPSFVCADTLGMTGTSYSSTLDLLVEFYRTNRNKKCKNPIRSNTIPSMPCDIYGCYKSIYAYLYNYPGAEARIFIVSKGGAPEGMLHIEPTSTCVFGETISLPYTASGPGNAYSNLDLRYKGHPLDGVRIEPNGSFEFKCDKVGKHKGYVTVDLY